MYWVVPLALAVHIVYLLSIIEQTNIQKDDTRGNITISLGFPHSSYCLPMSLIQIHA